MKMIIQPYGSMRCGQTCLAMVTDSTVDEVCKEMDKYEETLVLTDISHHLHKKGYFTRHIYNNSELTFDDIPDNSIIRGVNRNGRGHYVVKHKGKYYDPAIGIVEEYLNEFRPTNYIEYRCEQTEW